MTVRIKGKDYDHKELKKANTLFVGEGDPDKESLLAALAGAALQVLLLAGLAFCGFEAYPIVMYGFRRVFGNFMTDMHVNY